MRTFVIKMTNTITIKTNQTKLTFISVVGSLVQSSDKVGHLFIIFRDVTASAMFFVLFFPFCFDLLDALKDASFISRFFCLVLISYDVNIPCSSSMLIESRYTLSYSVDILGSNLMYSCDLIHHI
jgi:hypothetical protein